MLDNTLRNRLKDTVFQFLNPDSVTVFVFGSRASGLASKFSDVDLGIKSKEPIPVGTVSDIEEAFENSDLPYGVDIVDFSKVSDKFREIAEKSIIYLN
ncbi:MAG: nucleotidyltransferase domain-containing protein [Patescibacteria group bacterium]